MTQSPDTAVQATDGVELDRRGFLAGVGLALGALPLQSLAAAAAAPAPRAPGSAARRAGRRAIHQDLAYLDQDGTGQGWDAPPGNQATRDYVNSLTLEQYLSRHWYT